MGRIDPVRDLARLVAPQTPFTGMRFSQGTVLSWDPSDFTGTIEWRGVTLINVPVLSSVEALGFQAGDVVGLLGWAPSGGMGTWWIIGKLSIPGVDSPDLVVRGSNIILEGGDLISIDEEEDRWVALRDGRVEFGNVSGGLDNWLAAINAFNQDIEVGANFNAFLRAGNQVLIEAQGGHIIIEETGGGDIDITTTDTGDDIWVRAEGGLNLGAGGQVPVAGNGSIEIDASNQAALRGGSIAAIANSGNAGLILTLGSTATTGANIRAPGSGNQIISFITSSRRYKQDIADYHVNPRTILDLKPRMWRARSEVEQNPDTENWHVGFIAEEVDELDLTPFVDYDPEGRPETLAYDRFAVGLLEVCKWQQAQIEQLQVHVADLERRLGGLPWGDIDEPQTIPLPRRKIEQPEYVVDPGKDKRPPTRSVIVGDDEGKRP